VAGGEEAPTKDWFSALPVNSAFHELVDTAKLRWRLERDHREFKREAGLGCFQGPSRKTLVLPVRQHEAARNGIGAGHLPDDDRAPWQPAFRLARRFSVRATDKTGQGRCRRYVAACRLGCSTAVRNRRSYVDMNDSSEGSIG
jgi:hypothetical protein